jgi:hypothetical protein
MALKLNVGLSKKLGLPNYGSVGASCHVEIELDQSLLFNDLDGFHERVTSTFVACRQAVADELVRQRSLGDTASTDDDARSSLTAHESSDAERSPPPPTAKQFAYARKLAAQIGSLGLGRLDAYCESLFGKLLDDLTAPEASALIDALKDVKSGRTLLGEAEREAAA